LVLASKRRLYNRKLSLLLSAHVCLPVPIFARPDKYVAKDGLQLCKKLG